MSDRIITDGCCTCVVLQAKRLDAIVAGDRAALVEANGLIYAHLEEHEQAQLEAEWAKVRAARNDENLSLAGGHR